MVIRSHHDLNKSHDWRRDIFRRPDETLSWRNRIDDRPTDKWDKYASVTGFGRGRWPIVNHPYYQNKTNDNSYIWPYPYPIGYDTAKPYTAWQERYATDPRCQMHTQCTSLLTSNSKDDCTRCVYINGGDYDCANTLCNIPYV